MGAAIRAKGACVIPPMNSAEGAICFRRALAFMTNMAMTAMMARSIKPPMTPPAMAAALTPCFDEEAAD